MLMHVHVHRGFLESALIPVRADRVRKAGVPRFAYPLHRGTTAGTSHLSATSPCEDKALKMDLPSYLAIAAIAVVWLGGEFFAWYRTDRRHR